MAFVVKDRVKETSTTTGTGTFTLDGAATGFQGFSAIGNGNTTYYTITAGSQWEVGIGIYTASGTTLSRDTVLASSNNGNLVDFSAGSKDVYVVYPAGRAVIVNGSTVEVPNSALLPVSAGGTGSATASFSGANISGLNASNVSSGILAVAQGGTGSATASFSGANITSLNASNVTSGVLPLDHGGTGSATASFSGENITSLNASSFASGILPVLYGGTGSNSATFSGINITSINASNISSGTIANARTTASDANGASTIVARDASGNFTGYNVSATNFIGTLNGSGANVSSINASNISSGTIANARTTASDANGASTIVARDASGNFTGYNVSATNFIGTLNGSGANVSSINASNISSGTIANARTTATDVNGASTIVARDASGNFTGYNVSATNFIGTLNGSGANVTSINASNISSGTLNTARVSGSYTGITGVGTIAAGTWQGTSISTTYTDAKVTSITGTANQVIASAGTGAVTLSLPQSVNTASSVQFGSFGVGTAASGTSGEIRATNNITAYYTSDRKFKTNIKSIPNALEKVIAIGGKTFEWTEDYINDHGGEDEYFLRKNDFGVIAQDVLSVFPLAVRAKPDGTLAVDYEKLCALAFAAIIELKAEIDELKRSR